MWKQAISYLAQVATADARSGSLSNNQLRAGIVKRIFGYKTLTLKRLAEKTGGSEKTAKNHFAPIKRWLLGARHVKTAAAYGVIDLSPARTGAVLVETGIIAREVEC